MKAYHHTLLTLCQFGAIKSSELSWESTLSSSAIRSDPLPVWKQSVRVILFIQTEINATSKYLLPEKPEVSQYVWLF